MGLLIGLRRRHPTMGRGEIQKARHDMGKRPRAVNFSFQDFFTDEEKKEFSKAAEEAGVSVGELIRSLLRAYVEGKQVRK